VEDESTLHSGGLDRAKLLRNAGIGAAALSIPALAATREAFAAGARGEAVPFKKHPNWRFVFVNHVTTNPFFTPTQYGAADAAAIFGVRYQWTGSQKADNSEMINALNAAIAGRANGIAVSVVDTVAFEAPIKRALAAGIPVVSYNADGARTGAKARQAYIGQDLYLSGYEMGRRIVDLVKTGKVLLFIATPGTLNIQPRIDGAQAAIKAFGKGKVSAKVFATGPQLEEELAKIDAAYRANRDAKGMFAVDAGSTQGTGQTMKKYGLAAKGVRAGGYDLLPLTLQLINEGHLHFTIDQQPYLQGFIPVEQLFWANYSGGLVAPSDTNTGLLFVTKEIVKPYLTTKTRYEGSSSAQKYPIS
jgi:simple sugar transport system substrate-binding protein